MLRADSQAQLLVMFIDHIVRQVIVWIAFGLVAPSEQC